MGCRAQGEPRTQAPPARPPTHCRPRTPPASRCPCNRCSLLSATSFWSSNRGSPGSSPLLPGQMLGGWEQRCWPRCTIWVTQRRRRLAHPTTTHIQGAANAPSFSSARLIRTARITSAWWPQADRCDMPTVPARVKVTVSSRKERAIQSQVKNPRSHKRKPAAGGGGNPAAGAADGLNGGLTVGRWETVADGTALAPLAPSPLPTTTPHTMYMPSAFRG